MADPVRQYLAVYAMTLRLASEYDSLPNGTGGGTYTPYKGDAYGVALLNVCGDYNGDGSNGNVYGKMALLQDTSGDAPYGSLWAAIVHVHDGGTDDSFWFTQQVANLTALNHLFGFSTNSYYTGPAAITDMFNP